MVESGRFRSQKIEYDGPLWESKAIAPVLWNLLNQRDMVIEIGDCSQPLQVVLGAPHQAAPGVEQIAGDWINPRTGQYGRPADEMAGLLGLVVYSTMRECGLACRLVIAAHPTDHDPNKTPGSLYWDCLFSHPQPALILELHGAARRRRYELELSAGKNELASPLALGRRVVAELAGIWPGAWGLAAQLKPGECHGLLLAGGEEHPCRLQNPALQTDLLQAAGLAGIPALHLEAKRIFRRADPAYPHAPRPTRLAWDLARALTNAVIASGEILAPTAGQILS